ncbi:MAG: class I SAM-dependent DNA methyltransferase [Caldilineaceae bacterium]|nr:class I SAM-dependent DNA methyltransferase [Caldilineaceae bacterium]
MAKSQRQKAGARRKGASASRQSGSEGDLDVVDYKAELWRMADALRGSMDAAEYKHVVLGLIFLKYISDAFEEAHTQLEAERDEGADPEDPDEYRGQNIFWVPAEARWPALQAQARQPTIGQAIDDAMGAIERDNAALKDVLPKEYARPALDKNRLGQVVDLVSNIRVGGAAARATDVLGHVYEYFLEQFALAEGRKGGEFYTPRSVVQLLVEMLEPYTGRVYDPCCGSAGMFVQSLAFIRAHASGNGNGGRARGDISIYGQESNYTTWRMARMNLAIRGIEGLIEHGDSFHNDRHPDLRADYILANPPFNVSDWGGERLREDKRWQYGAPPVGNANFAWVQHFLFHLAPRGTAGFVLANGSMSSSQSSEGEIRSKIIEADLVDCIVALPGQLFRSTQIPACLWFLARGRGNGEERARRGETLFIDARKLGYMVDRAHRDLSAEDIGRVADTYHAWRSKEGRGEYADVPGFCRSAGLEEIRKHGHVLTPGRYVGAAPQEDDGIPFEEKMGQLAAQWRAQQEEAGRLDGAIAANLEQLGFGSDG